MDLEIRHLRVIVTIADHRSITKAATALGMSQPSLTGQLKRIESEIGGRLFERGRDGVAPTALGRDLLSRAREMITEMERFRAAGQGETTPHRELRIGSGPGALLPTAVPFIESRCGLATITVSVHPDTAAGLIGRVQAGNLHAAVVTAMTGFPVDTPTSLSRTTVIPREPFFVALAESHPLSRKAAIHLADLAEERWVTDATDDLLDLVPLRAACAAAGFEPIIAHRLTDTNAARVFIADGHCVSLAQAISREDRGIAVRPLVGDPLTTHIDLVWSDRCDADPDLIVAALREGYAKVVASSNPAYRVWLSRRS